MTKIVPIAKYDEQNKNFNTDIKTDQKEYAFSLVRQAVISDENSAKFDYIIFANGNRAKDVSNDGTHPRKERDYTNKIAKYFKSKNKNVIIEHLLVDQDAPLDIDSRLIARYIDRLAEEENIETINLIGHSKCGNVLFNMPKYFKNEESFKKCSLVTSASPFLGCLIASPKFFLRNVKEVIDAKLPKHLAKIVYKALVNYYNSITSSSHMDNDIALPGYETDKYDPDFIKGMFDLVNINAVKRLRDYNNFITGIDDKSLINSIKRGDFTSVGLCLLNEFFMQELTDGFIEVRSQESVNQYFSNPSIRVKSATHYYLSHEDELAIVLDYVSDKIDEYKDRLIMKKTL